MNFLSRRGDVASDDDDEGARVRERELKRMIVMISARSDHRCRGKRYDCIDGISSRSDDHVGSEYFPKVVLAFIASFGSGREKVSRVSLPYDVACSRGSSNNRCFCRASVGSASLKEQIASFRAVARCVGDDDGDDGGGGGGG